MRTRVALFGSAQSTLDAASRLVALCDGPVVHLLADLDTAADVRLHDLLLLARPGRLVIHNGSPTATRSTDGGVELVLRSGRTVVVDTVNPMDGARKPQTNGGEST